MSLVNDKARRSELRRLTRSRNKTRAARATARQQRLAELLAVTTKWAAEIRGLILAEIRSGQYPKIIIISYTQKKRWLRTNKVQELKVYLIGQFVTEEVVMSLDGRQIYMRKVVERGERNGNPWITLAQSVEHFNADVSYLNQLETVIFSKLANVRAIAMKMR